MTDRIVIQKAGDDGFVPHEPLTWNWEGDGLWVVCANGHIAGLQHDVDSEGNISPSIHCVTPMADREECGWHVWARLENY